MGCLAIILLLLIIGLVLSIVFGVFKLLIFVPVMLFKLIFVFAKFLLPLIVVVAGVWLLLRIFGGGHRHHRDDD